MTSKKHVARETRPRQKAAQAPAAARRSASHVKSQVARRCEDCRAETAFHAWREIHMTPSFNTMVSFDDVPPGKRAVIELVTATLSVPAGERARLRLFTSLGQSPSNLDLFVVGQGDVDGSEQLIATHSLRVYSDQLIEFNVNRDNAETEGDAFICISGYLVDA